MQSEPQAIIMNEIQYLTPTRLPIMVDRGWSVTNVTESYDICEFLEVMLLE
jgi:hypothetical protein